MSRYTREANKVVNKVVEVEHPGTNRAAMRAHGVRSKDRPDPQPAPEHWLRVRKAEIEQQKLEFADATQSDAEPKPHHAEPKNSEWRWKQYGNTPTHSQLRRMTKKFRKAFSKED